MPTSSAGLQFVCATCKAKPTESSLHEHLAVVTAEDYGVVDIGKVGHVDVGSNLNPSVILQSLAKNPVDYVIKEGRGESTSLSNAGANLKGH